MAGVFSAGFLEAAALLATKGSTASHQWPFSFLPLLPWPSCQEPSRQPQVLPLPYPAQGCDSWLAKKSLGMMRQFCVLIAVMEKQIKKYARIHRDPHFNYF